MESVEVSLPTGLVVALDEWAARLGVDGPRIARAWWKACRNRGAVADIQDGETVTLEMDDGWAEDVDNPKAALRGALLAAQARTERSGMIHPETREVIIAGGALELNLEPVVVNGVGQLLRCTDCGRGGVLSWLRVHRCGEDRSAWAEARRANR